LQNIAGEREVADPPIAVRGLHHAERMLHGGADGDDQLVAPLLPERQSGLVAAASIHDAIFDALGLEPPAPLLVLIGAIVINRPRVALDQLIGDRALVNLGRRENGPADQAQIVGRRRLAGPRA